MITTKYRKLSKEQVKEFKKGNLVLFCGKADFKRLEKEWDKMPDKESSNNYWDWSETKQNNWNNFDWYVCKEQGAYTYKHWLRVCREKDSERSFTEIPIENGGRIYIVAKHS